MQQAIVGPKGRITIPKAIRDRLGLKPGAKVQYVITSDGRVALTAAG
jgi:AbrB family looped-hinge helix DNA binding protein